MKQIQFIFLAYILLLLGCKVQEIVIVEAQVTKLEPGKCYFSAIKKNGQKKEKAFILELIPAEYEDVIIEVTDEEIQKYQNTFRLETRPPSTRCVIKNISESSRTNAANINGYIFCIVENPGLYRNYTREDLAKAGNKIAGQRIKSNSKIIKRYVKKRPKKLLPNQYFYKSDYWTKLEEVVGAGGCGNGQFILEVKKALNKLGYDLEENNTFNEKTKAALIDFQKKNGLKSGQLDFKTLKKLGVSY